MRPLVLSAVLVLGALPASAEAPSATAKKEAGFHYQRAVALYKEGNYAAALSEFRAAHEALPSIEVLFNIGLSERRLFKYPQAIRTFNRYLTEGAGKVPADRRAAVAQELDQIRVLTAPVAVFVKGAPARVFIDGELFATTPFSELVPLGPGRHQIRAEREGDAPDEQTLEVVAGAGQAITLEPRSLTAPVLITFATTPPDTLISVDDAAPQPASAPIGIPPGVHEIVVRKDGYATQRTEVSVAPGVPRTVKLELVAIPVARPRSVKRPFPVVGVTVAGAGVAAIAGGFAFSLQAQGTSQRVTAYSKTGGPWDSKWATTEADGQRAQGLAWGLWGVGGAAVAAGAVLSVLSLVADPPDEPTEPPAGKTAVHLVPVVGGAALGLSGSF